MPISPELFIEIESCDYLFLCEINEPEDNSLRLVVEEAVAAQETTSKRIGDAIIKDLHRIESTNASRSFELTWDEYVAYLVTNESYALSGDSEQTISGRFVQVYARSHFLNHVSRTTFANAEYPGPLQHICIICENHVIDVVSWIWPKLRRLR